MFCSPAAVSDIWSDSSENKRCIPKETKFGKSHWRLHQWIQCKKMPTVPKWRDCDSAGWTMFVFLPIQVQGSCLWNQKIENLWRWEQLLWYYYGQKYTFGGYLIWKLAIELICAKLLDYPYKQRIKIEWIVEMDKSAFMCHLAHSLKIYLYI